jgi:hypothetical protein
MALRWLRQGGAALVVGFVFSVIVSFATDNGEASILAGCKAPCPSTDAPKYSAIFDEPVKDSKPRIACPFSVMGISKRYSKGWAVSSPAPSATLDIWISL